MADSDKTPSLSYRDAGVDIDAGNRLIERIKPYAQRTRRPGVMTGLGGFGALFELPLDRYKHPVLVSGTDGVGTKLKLALELGIHDSIGIDLVAMCVNDIVVTGAEPLFFLDYYATGKLDIDVAADVIKGIAAGCERAGAALTGGETAEMPGMYGEGDYDLAGFCVGVVEKDRLIDATRVQAGDALIALGSSGPHSNGYSLIRRILEHGNTPLHTPFEGATLGEALLAPTQIYVKPLLALLASHEVHALAHITGGGLTENLPRVLPRGLKARVHTHAWSRPGIFQWLQEAGNVEEEEMLRTFNCGVGMCVVLAENQVAAALQHFSDQGIEAWRIGSIEPSEDAEPHVEYMTE